MSVELEDSKRTAIASKLADMKAFQNLLIANEEALIKQCPDREITDRLEDFLRDDRKNLGILDTVIVQYGVKAEPKETTQKAIEEVGKLMQGSELTLYEKVAQHELLKHGQTMSGIIVHKAAQVVGADVEVAIGPLNAVNFENRAHQEQLKGIMESLGTMELTGKEADQGLWARVQDGLAALTGIAGSVASRTDNEMKISDLIRLDHTKVNTLFGQIKATDDPAKIEEYYAQIYKDLSAHSEAEEQVVYPALRPYYTDTQELYDEQAKMKQTLDRIKAMNPHDTVAFKAAVDQLMNAVMEHVRQEENEALRCIQDNFGDDQQKQMATQFKTAKSEFQDRMMADSSK
jgi:hemerythrin superfamily protein